MKSFSLPLSLCQRYSRCPRSGAPVSGVAILFFVLPLLLTLQPKPATAEIGEISTARFTLHFAPENGVQTRSAKQVAEDSLRMLDQSYIELSELFDFRPTEKVLIRFFSPKEFHRHTGAPEWTSAMYLRGEISIPLPDRKPINQEQVMRAVKHEYVHAVTAEISGRKCPAWLDEGLAQIIEGDPNPLLGPALRRWLASNPPMALSSLKNGFTTLPDEVVPAAYAHSLFATRVLINEQGYRPVKHYLLSLRGGNSDAEAFRNAFGEEQSVFEERVGEALAKWVKGSDFDP